MTNPNVAKVPLYFGCRHVVGHSFYLPGGKPAGAYKQVAALLPFDGPDDGPYEGSGGQSIAQLEHGPGWTALGMADRTVDTRGGSVSVFFLPVEDLTFDQAVSAAREAFPTIVARIECAAPITGALGI